MLYKKYGMVNVFISSPELCDNHQADVAGNYQFTDKVIIQSEPALPLFI
jgi:hypothetical protein